MADYGLQPQTVPNEPIATMGQNILQNAIGTEAQEAAVARAQELAKQAKLQTGLEQAGGLQAEKGLIPKSQALGQVRVLLDQRDDLSDAQKAQIMNDAESSFPDYMNSYDFSRYWNAISEKRQPAQQKGSEFIATAQDAKDEKRKDEQGEPLVEGQRYIAMQDGTYVRSGVPSAVEAAAAREKAGPSANWVVKGNSVDNRPILENTKTGELKYGDTSGIGNSPILPPSSTMPTSQTRSTSEFAETLLPHLDEMRQLIGQADAKGYIGPLAGRVYGQFLADKVGSTGDEDADKLLGQLRAVDSLVKSGTLKVHFGSRGGQQMYDHFSDMLNSGKQSAAVLNGALDGIEKFMEGYVRGGQPKGIIGGPGVTANTGAGNDPLGIR